LRSDEQLQATTLSEPPERGSAEWEDLRERVAEISTPHGAFYLLVALSTTIAAFGLLANSTAVVIGAMLVAPLMGPIFGIGLGLATGDTDLLGRAAAGELKGVVLAIALAALIGLLAPIAGLGPEIISRTRPTLYDVVVALASGLAGAFALADRRVGVALPGVAIATAIVPPLAATGLTLAVGDFRLATGAFLLFVANLLAIEVAAVAYYTWLGMREGHLHEHFTVRGFLRHFGVSVVLLIAIAIFMTRTLLEGVARERRRDEISSILSEEVRITQGARLTDLILERRGDSLQVLAVFLTPQEIGPAQIARLEQRVQATSQRPIHLVVRSILSRDADRFGPVYVAEDELRRRTEADQQTRFLSRASTILRSRFDAIPGVELEEIRRDRLDGENVVTLVVRTPVAVEPIQVDSMERELELALEDRVRLIVRSVLTRDADARGFLYDSVAVDTAPPPVRR
jgi:uncharacterized hydrophobic protein (TIGR00271 family)